MSRTSPFNYPYQEPMMRTLTLAPIREAPASIIARASAWFLIPPAALTPIIGPTVRRIKATSAAVAPDWLKPVEVLTKSAPASALILQAVSFSSSVNRQVSMITFSVLLPHAAFTVAMSFRTCLLYTSDAADD